MENKGTKGRYVLHFLLPELSKIEHATERRQEIACVDDEKKNGLPRHWIDSVIYESARWEEEFKPVRKRERAKRVKTRAQSEGGRPRGKSGPSSV